jgi:hypothetical protein
MVRLWVDADHGSSRLGERSGQQARATAQVYNRPRIDLVGQRAVVRVVLAPRVVEVVQLDQVLVTVRVVDPERDHGRAGARGEGFREA